MREHVWLRGGPQHGKFVTVGDPVLLPSDDTGEYLLWGERLNGRGVLLAGWKAKR